MNPKKPKTVFSIPPEPYLLPGISYLENILKKVKFKSDLYFTRHPTDEPLSTVHMTSQQMHCRGI